MGVYDRERLHVRKVVTVTRRPKGETLAYLEGARNAYALAAQISGLPGHIKEQFEALAKVTEAERLALVAAP